MSLVSDNIRFLRRREGLTQEQFANKIGIKRSLVGAYEESRADPRLSNLLAIAKYFNISVDDLISKDLTSFSLERLKQLRRHELKVLAISVNDEGRENIEFVPVKASAGYTSGHSDPDFIESLPRFTLPNLSPNQTYRAFEIRGDSMLPVLPGTIVVGTYLDTVEQARSGKCYVLVTKDDGIVFKRVYLKKGEERLYLVSDNNEYSPYYLHPEDILELWEAVSLVSNQVPEPFSGKEVDSLEKLMNVVLELKREVGAIKARL